jgi:ribose transport system substrate-binding protein
LATWVLTALLLGGCSSEADPGPPEPAPEGQASGEAEIRLPAAEKKLTIAVIPKGTTHEFWKSIHAGAVKAERELGGVRIIWEGPVVEDDRSGQIKLVETFTADRVDGLVVAPLDDAALVRPIVEAREAGIPVVIIDSGLKDEEAYVSFVATDNYEGGRIAGRRMVELLGEGGGKVILMRYQVGSASTENRERGFLDAVGEAPGVKVVSANQYGGATVDTARQTATALLTRFAAGEVDGIFCPNESSTYGMLQALRGEGRAGTVAFVGFDVSAKLIDALKTEELDGIVVQNPLRMGYEGVRTVVAHIRGEDVAKRIDTGVTLVTKANLSAPEIERLIHPPLREYLE